MIAQKENQDKAFINDKVHYEANSIEINGQRIHASHYVYLRSTRFVRKSFTEVQAVF